MYEAVNSIIGCYWQKTYRWGSAEHPWRISIYITGLSLYPWGNKNYASVAKEAVVMFRDFLLRCTLKKIGWHDQWSCSWCGWPVVCRAISWRRINFFFCSVVAIHHKVADIVARGWHRCWKAQHQCSAFWEKDSETQEPFEVQKWQTTFMKPWNKRN